MMTKQYGEQVAGNQSIPPLTLEELRLALQEYDEDGQNEQANRERRRAALLQMIGTHPALFTADSSTSPAARPAVKSVVYTESTPGEAEKVIERNLLIDGKPVHINARVGDELRRAYVQQKQADGHAVEYDLIDPEDDVTSFRGSDQAELAGLLANDGMDQEAPSTATSLDRKLGIVNTQGEFPLEKRKRDILRSKKVVRVGAVALAAAAIATTAVVLPKGTQGGGDSAAAVSVPGSATEDVKKHVDVQALISDCAPDKIGASVASGVMSVDAGVIWNIPGGTDQFPKLSLGAWDQDNNPSTAPVNEPRYLPVTANNVNLAVAVCDTPEKPAVSLQGDAFHVDLASVSPQVAFDASAKNAPELSALKQEDLNKFVAQKWMSQEAADTLRKNMIDPKMAIAAAKETLHGVVEQMKQKDNKTGLAVVTALKERLQAAIATQLPKKADGKPFDVILDGALTNERIQGVGVDVVANQAFAIDTPRIITETINPPASEVK